MLKRNEYPDIRNIKKSYDKGVKLIHIPYRRSALLLAGGIIVIALITPFTNFILIPFAGWIIRRYA